MERIERVQGLEPERFIAEYLVKNLPVIVTDAMETWPLHSWSPASLQDAFGDREVQVYDTLFSLMDTCSLREYLQSNFNRNSDYSSQEYVRWYIKLKEVDFVWADEAFEVLKDDWATPYFFPRNSFLLPPCGPDESISAAQDMFPYKGLLISGRGARTRLHKDPYGTDAMLCQFYGRKDITFYPPQEDRRLHRNGQFVDPVRPDVKTFPEFGQVRATHKDVLEAGEILFIPGGWFHDVLSVSDSVSVTWNFVHAAHKDLFEREVADISVQHDRDVLEYFLSAAQ
jgi:hypothetical protein